MNDSPPPFLSGRTVHEIRCLELPTAICRLPSALEQSGLLALCAALACGAFEGGGVHVRVIRAIRLYRHKRTLLFVAENLAEEN